jgi:electron transfer flavoprotein alpha subunit
LREATATPSGEQLRELSRQQRQLVFALVQQARRLARTAGRKVSEDTARGLEDTLRAALADPEAAEALTAGRLTEGMQNIGFGSPTSPDERPARSATEPTAAAAAPTPTARQPGLEQRKRAEHDVEQAKSAADEAMRERKGAHDQLEAADQVVADTRGLVERVRRELEEALQAQSGAKEDQTRAQVAFDRADRGAREAQQRLADATERFDRLVR